MLFRLLQVEEHLQKLYQINSHNLRRGLIRYNHCGKIQKIGGNLRTNEREGEKHPENTQIHLKLKTKKTKK